MSIKDCQRVPMHASDISNGDSQCQSVQELRSVLGEQRDCRRQGDASELGNQVVSRVRRICSAHLGHYPNTATQGWGYRRESPAHRG